MKCFFCQNECRNREDFPSSPVQGSWCSNHPHIVAHYWYKDRPTGIISISYYYEYGDTMWKFSYIINGGENGNENSFQLENALTDQVMVYFDFIPDITPENALRKLPTLIIFS